jgi:hypothetical protein
MVDIKIIKKLDGTYTVEFDEYILNELTSAVHHLNKKRTDMNKNYDRVLKNKKGEDYVKKEKKKKEILNLVVIESIDYID